ncbi:MAG: hypothetical protein ACJAT1_000179 [Marivirga sp.]|jgi:hypothetical protein
MALAFSNVLVSLSGFAENKDFGHVNHFNVDIKNSKIFSSMALSADRAIDQNQLNLGHSQYSK